MTSQRYVNTARRTRTTETGESVRRSADQGLDLSFAFVFCVRRVTDAGVDLGAVVRVPVFLSRRFAKDTRSSALSPDSSENVPIRSGLADEGRHRPMTSPRRRPPTVASTRLEVTLQALHHQDRLGPEHELIELARSTASMVEREQMRLVEDPTAPGYTLAQLSRAHLNNLVELMRQAEPVMAPSLEDLVAAVSAPPQEYQGPSVRSPRLSGGPNARGHIVVTDVTTRADIRQHGPARSSVQTRENVRIGQRSAGPDTSGGGFESLPFRGQAFAVQT